MEPITNVVVAIEPDKYTDELIKFICECGGNPTFVTTEDEAIRALIDLPVSKSSCMVVSYQLAAGLTHYSPMMLIDKINFERTPRIFINTNADAKEEVIKSVTNGDTNSKRAFIFDKSKTTFNESEFFRRKDEIRGIFRDAQLAFIEYQRILEHAQDGEDVANSGVLPTSISTSTSTPRAFIAHRTDSPAFELASKVLRGLSIEPISIPGSLLKISARTTIEKLEMLINDQVDKNYFGIVLFTKDCHFRYGEKENELCVVHSRQNVVMEAGYLIGALGRDKLLFFAEDGVKIPTNLDGIVPKMIEDNTSFPLAVFEFLQGSKIIAYT